MIKTKFPQVDILMQMIFDDNDKVGEKVEFIDLSKREKEIQALLIKGNWWQPVSFIDTISTHFKLYLPKASRTLQKRNLR